MQYEEHRFTPFRGSEPRVHSIWLFSRAKRASAATNKKTGDAQVKETKREREKNRKRERGKEREIEWDRRRAFKSPVSKAERSQRRRSCASTRESARADKMSSRRGSERCHHRVILQQIGLHSIRWREATYETIQPRIAAGWTYLTVVYTRKRTRTWISTRMYTQRGHTYTRNGRCGYYSQLPSAIRHVATTSLQLRWQVLLRETIANFCHFQFHSSSMRHQGIFWNRRDCLNG